MATTTGAPAGALNGALEGLRATVRGEVNAPDIRPVFNAMHRGQPAVTISCTGTADVIEAVNFAREHNLPVAVRGGGHSIAGLSSITAHSAGGFERTGRSSELASGRAPAPPAS